MQQDLFDPKEYSSLSDRVYRYLRDCIIEGKYRTGDSLIELKLAEELGVSRTPVREALKQLELEEFIEATANRGVVVKGFSENDFRDSFTIRLLLEGQAAYWAAERITITQLDKLAEILELMDLYTRRKDAGHLVRLDTEFHEVLYDACDCRTLRHILRGLHMNMHRARQHSLTIPDRAGESLLEHRQIYSALESHDAMAAKTCMERHISYAAVSTKE